MAKLSRRKGENAFPKTVKLLKSTKNIPKVMVKLLKSTKNIPKNGQAIGINKKKNELARPSSAPHCGVYIWF